MAPKILNAPNPNFPEVHGSAPTATTNVITKVPGGVLYSNASPIVSTDAPISQWYPGVAPNPVPAGRYARQ